MIARKTRVSWPVLAADHTTTEAWLDITHSADESAKDLVEHVLNCISDYRPRVTHWLRRGQAEI